MAKPKLKPRSDGRYQKSIFDEKTGERKYFYGHSEREINKKILEYERKLEEGKTFAELANEWWNDAYERLALQSIKSYKPALARAICYFGKISIKKITSRDISQFFKQLAYQGYAHRTVANQRIVINQILNYAAVEGEIQYNPCTVVAVPKGLKMQQREAATPEEERKILTTDHPWLFPVIALLTGLRKGEILALQWRDVDFKHKIISITKNVEHEGDRPSIKVPKTEAGFRIVPLLDILAKKLAKHKGKPEEFIISDTGDTPLTNRRYITLFKHYQQAVGVKCTAHQLRHSYATIAVEEGVSAKELQGALGHASVTTTLNIYSQYREKSVAHIAQKLNDFYTESSK